MNIQLEVTEYQVGLLIKILKNYLKLRKKLFYDIGSGIKQFNYHDEAILVEGLVVWLEDKLKQQELDQEQGFELYKRSLAKQEQSY